MSITKIPVSNDLEFPCYCVNASVEQVGNIVNLITLARFGTAFENNYLFLFLLAWKRAILINMLIPLHLVLALENTFLQLTKYFG